IEYNKFGLKNDKLTFSDFVDLISNELSRQNLNKCVELAEKYGLSELTMDDINKEAKAVRKNAENNNGLFENGKMKSLLGENRIKMTSLPE
ncbi:MAG: hypothetical protein ACHQIM_22685, partial [Sphingobacteriales bacterium]